jgi:hypothetical protein
MSAAQMKAQVDKLLTAASSKFVPTGFISEVLLPFIGVVQTTGKFGKHGLGHLRIVNTLAGGRGRFPSVDVRTYSTVNYEIEAHGLEGMVSPQDYRNVEDPFDAEKDETDAISTMLFLGKEKSLADTLADTAVLTQNVTLSGTSQFSDYANSDPLSVAATARKAVRDGSGMAPNALWMDWAVYNVLRFHPAVLDYLGFKDSRPGGLTGEELAKAFDVKRVLIAESMYNSAKQGQADVLAPIWGKHMWFGVAPEKAAKDQVSLGYRLGYAGKSPRQVSKWDLNNPSGAKAILVEDHYDQLLSNAGAAYLVKNAIA